MEAWLKIGIAGGGAIAAHLYGGWNWALTVLVWLVVIDFVTGMIAAGIEGKLKSKISFVGAAKKVGILLVIAVAHLVDTLIGDGNMVRDAAILFYVVNELLSLVENFGRIGLPVPKVLTNAVEVLKQKGDAK